MILEVKKIIDQKSLIRDLKSLKMLLLAQMRFSYKISFFISRSNYYFCPKHKDDFQKRTLPPFY
jgi:hypothetical protein